MFGDLVALRGCNAVCRGELPRSDSQALVAIIWVLRMRLVKPLVRRMLFRGGRPRFRRKRSGVLRSTYAAGIPRYLDRMLQGEPYQAFVAWPRRSARG